MGPATAPLMICGRVSRAERAAYRRGVWPDAWRAWRLQNDARLVGDRVEMSAAHVSAPSIMWCVRPAGASRR